MNNKIDHVAKLQWDEYGNPSPLTGETAKLTGDNPDNIMTDNTLNMTVLREYITMYLNDISSYDDEHQLTEATTVLDDFVKYIDAIQ